MSSEEFPTSLHTTRIEKGSYQLPPLIRVTGEGMINSFGSIAVVATLLGTMEALLLVFQAVVTSDTVPRQSLQKTVTALAYIGIVLNLGSLWSALRMVDVLGKMPFLNARHEVAIDTQRSPVALTRSTSTHDLMAAYGLRGIWTFIAWHCIMSLLFGSLCILAQIAITVWLYEVLAVAIPIMVLVVFAAIPMLLSFVM